MAGLQRTAASLLFPCLVAVLAFVAGMKREQIPEYFPTKFSTRFFSEMANTQNTSLAAQYQEKGCPTVPYSTQIFSLDPLVIYIRGFIPPSEREYLINLAQPDFAPSTVSVEYEVRPTLRTSSSAHLPSDDAVVYCVLRRAANFQGHLPLARLEQLQLVRYRPGEQYRFHNDWDVGDPPEDMRSTTFFAYLGCEGCVGGSTRFYHLSREGKSKKWCDVVDCEETVLKGVRFLPVDGNAVFWENLKDGVGMQEVLHAGQALENGTKYGLNIWTRTKIAD